MLHGFHGVGAYAALAGLGLTKYAALGAKTILPMASGMADNIGQKIPNLQTASSAALPAPILKQPTIQQYAAVAGPGSKTESATSKWFRRQLQHEMAPSEVTQMSQNFQDMAALRPNTNVVQESVTMRPPRLPKMASVWYS